MARLLAGLFLVFALFQWIASALGSDRGQAGLVVGVVIVPALVGVERVLFGVSAARAVRDLGLTTGDRRGLLASAGLGLLLVSVIPSYAFATGTAFSMYPGWLLLLPGLFAQGGIAEEVLFRGYLFRHVRAGRSFWRAAVVASGPFVLVHLLLFLTLPWPLAVASVLLAVVISFPLAYLFELGGNTIWAPAVLHSVVQGAIKVVVPDDSGATFPLVWIAASAVLSFLAFLVPMRRKEKREWVEQ